MRLSGVKLKMDWVLDAVDEKREMDGSGPPSFFHCRTTSFSSGIFTSDRIR